MLRIAETGFNRLLHQVARALTTSSLVAVVAGCVAVEDRQDAKAHAAHEEAEVHGSLNSEWLNEMHEGKLAGDHSAVDALILSRDIPIPYDYISTLMRTPNAFGQGPACIVCHASSDVRHSYRGLDLSTCEGMRTGVTEGRGYPIFTPGKKAKRSVLGRRLRNNRMPLGIPFNVAPNLEAVSLVNRWIADGAPDNAHFRDTVLPLFSTANAFAPNTAACTACHMSNQEPPSFHEMDLTSHAGIMLGADSVAKGVANATKIVIPGNPAASSLLQHVTENRMPPGISPTEDRDHPNTRILFRWIEQGASCQ